MPKTVMHRVMRKKANGRIHSLGLYTTRQKATKRMKAYMDGKKDRGWTESDQGATGAWEDEFVNMVWIKTEAPDSDQVPSSSSSSEQDPEDDASFETQDEAETEGGKVSSTPEDEQDVEDEDSEDSDYEDDVSDAKDNLSEDGC